MLIAMKWLAISIVLSWIAIEPICAKTIQKRQSAIDELINKALSIVQPIFNVNIDKHRLAQSDAMIPPASLDALNPLVSERDNRILGAPKYDKLDDVPICKGNSQICKFISCTAQNFKNDESFDNLNLAAQVLGDRDLRHAVSSDPGIMNAVCSEREMSPSQCSLFTSGFKLIDKFMTSVEDMNAKGRRRIVVDHSHDTGPTRARQIDSRRPLSPISNRTPQSGSLTNFQRDATMNTEIRRSPPRAPRRRHRARSQVLNTAQPALWPAAQPVRRRTIFTTNTNQDSTLSRRKRADDYYDQVKRLDRRRGGQRGERRRHPSSTRHQSTSGGNGGSGSDGKADYYSNYETEEQPETQDAQLDCLKIIGVDVSKMMTLT